ncbi:proteasome assembly chaperone 3 [Xenentodon cancila]
MSEPIIKSKTAQKEVNGISTQVVCTEFSNYIFVVLTQYGKIGTLISVTPDSRSNDISTPTFSTKVLLGKDEPMTHVCAKNLATFVSQGAGNRPVLLGLALKDSSIDAISQLKEIIKSCQVCFNSRRYFFSFGLSEWTSTSARHLLFNEEVCSVDISADEVQV